MKSSGDAKATDGVKLSGVPDGTGLMTDSTLEKLRIMSAEGAKSLRQKDKVILFPYCGNIVLAFSAAYFKVSRLYL